MGVNANKDMGAKKRVVRTPGSKTTSTGRGGHNQPASSARTVKLGGSPAPK